MNKARFFQKWKYALGAIAIVIAGIVIRINPFSNYETFSVVLLPDTQYYSEKDPGAYYSQMNWIIGHQDIKNILYVIHLGDIVDNDQSYFPPPFSEWGMARIAHDMLDDNGIPYTVIPGNHDLPLTEWGGRSRDTENYNAYFGVDKFSGSGFEHHQGNFPPGKNDNNYSFFESEGIQFMVLGLEYAPTKDAMCWAGDVLEANPDRRTIVVTHCYQKTAAAWNESCDLDEIIVGSSGEALWHELLSRYPQVFMIVNGHYGESQYRKPPIDRGNWGPVYEIITDFQYEHYINESEHKNIQPHGNGFLRVLEFRPETSTIFSYIESSLGIDSLRPGTRAVGKYSDTITDHEFEFENFDMLAPIPGIGDPVPDLDKFYDRSVNVDDHKDQLRPVVAKSASGDFIVVWEDDSHGDEDCYGGVPCYQIYARGFDSNGCEKFPPIVVNGNPAGQQIRPDIAMDSLGNFVVVWQDDIGDDGKFQIKMRGFNSDGTIRFDQKTANAVKDNQQLDPTISMDVAGNFVVAWEDNSENASHYQIMMRGYDKDGNPDPDIPQQVVNTSPDGQHYNPEISMSSFGEFVIVWQDDTNPPYGTYQIKMRGYSQNGTPKSFPSHTVNSVSTNQQKRPDVAMRVDGGFIVVWEDNSDNSNHYQIKMRGFDRDGNEYLPQATVNSKTSGDHYRPVIAMTGNGDFVVAWQDDSSSPWEIYQIYARRFSAAGVPYTNQEKVNRNDSHDQIKPSITIDDNGLFVVAWQDDLEDDDWWEILARGCDLISGCKQ